MWFLPGNTSDSFAVCNSPADMLSWVADQGQQSGGESPALLSKCCEMGDYWRIKKQREA